MLNKNFYNFSPSNFLNWITAFCIFEIPLALFYLYISKETDKHMECYSTRYVIWIMRSYTCASII